MSGERGAGKKKKKKINKKKASQIKYKHIPEFPSPFTIPHYSFFFAHFFFFFFFFLHSFCAILLGNVYFVFCCSALFCPSFVAKCLPKTLKIEIMNLTLVVFVFVASPKIKELQQTAAESISRK